MHRQIQLENISFREVWNARSVWEHLDRWSHVCLSELREILATSLNAIVSKNVNIFSNCYCIFATYIKFREFSKQRSASYLQYFGSYWHGEMQLLECPKATVLDHLWWVNEFTGEKNCWNQHGSTFILLFY